MAFDDQAMDGRNRGARAAGANGSTNRPAVFDQTLIGKGIEVANAVG
jgi:hypothetical protein